MSTALNVLGMPLVACSYDPLTGWSRDGCCHADERDADELFDSHLLAGKPVQRLLYVAPPGNNKEISGYPPVVREMEKQEKANDKRRAALYAQLRAEAASASAAAESKTDDNADDLEQVHAHL